MSIRARKKMDGTVTYQVRVKDSAGRYMYHRTGRKVDAVAWEREMLKKVQEQGFKTVQSTTFETASDYWLENHSKPNKASSGFITDKYLLRAWILPVLGGKHLDKITPNDIRAIGSRIQQAGYSNATANRCLNVVRKIFNDLIRYEWYGSLYRNPCDQAGRYREDQKEMKYWLPDDANHFLETCKKTDSKYFPIFAFLLNTGARVGEAQAIQVQDLCFESGLITVSKSYCNKTYRIKTTKSGRVRHVGMNSPLVSILRQQVATTGGEPEKLVFSNTVGNPWNMKKLQMAMTRVASRAGVRRIRLHDIRHTFAANFIMNGGDIYTLQKILGHSSVKTTERYSHLSQGHLRKAAEVVSFSTPTGRILKAVER